MACRRVFGRGAGDGFECVCVQHVVEIAVGDEQILESIQIDIQESGAPSPLGCVEAAEAGELSIGPIPAAYVKRVAQNLRAIFEVVHRQVQFLEAESISSL